MLKCQCDGCDKTIVMDPPKKPRAFVLLDSDQTRTVKLTVLHYCADCRAKLAISSGGTGHVYGNGIRAAVRRFLKKS